MKGFWKKLFLTLIYIINTILNMDLRTHSRLHAWKDVTVQEMYVFLAITMLMTGNRRLTTEEHWSTNPFLNSPIYKTLMSRNHPEARQPDGPVLSKINVVINDARTKFQNLFIPNQKLRVDESIVPFKGRLIIKQYLPNKRNLFGIKLFVFCDVDTKIILDFIIYLILTFEEKYYFTNRIIYMDNWYSSPKLFDFLASRGIGACGTVKKTRKVMPKLSTTIHKDEMEPSEKMDRSTGLPVMKPELYTNDMIGIEKVTKWYKKLFFHIIDLQTHACNSKKLRCKVCSHLYRRRRETRYLCEICKVPLRVTCFRTYHEKRYLNV
ncbi:hypothetical protein ABMA28_003305 [Loxostege sticticalis]|uniref:PiggyBac transposable element-derived protein domain-containing protein n=1 Tax=Loxostege sticticalis TaxID=481309 RepID=A0ABD0SVN5_LOXSC